MINWQQFGLRSNPYDTLPLIEGGELPIDKAFVGRTTELQSLKDIFLSDSRTCLTILGNVGVGKTSLANFHKFLFKYEEKKKSLFSFRREIEASKNLLNKKSFITEVIGSTLREIRLLDPDLIKKEELLQKLEKLVDITQSLDISAGISIAGFGGEFGRTGVTEYPPSISNTMLENYFSNLVMFIKTNEIAGKRFDGLIVHINNFDVVLSDSKEKKDVIRFFQEIRDILQTRDVYYLFLGPRHFFRDIISIEKRLKSVFHLSPLVVNPLSKIEIIQAFEERMELLKSPDVVKYIAPFSNDAIFSLYDLCEGDARSIMNGLKDILSQVPETVLEPLGVDEAMLLLGKERWELIRKSELTKEQEELLIFLATSSNYVTQKDLAIKLKKAPSNISGYYFNPLRDAGIIEVKKQEGKLKYWGLTQDYLPIKFILKTKKTIQQKTKENMQQLTLFTPGKSK